MRGCARESINFQHLSISQVPFYMQPKLERWDLNANETIALHMNSFVGHILVFLTIGSESTLVSKEDPALRFVLKLALLCELRVDDTAFCVLCWRFCQSKFNVETPNREFEHTRSHNDMRHTLWYPF